jgi:excisionase family DNA binding protein
MQTAIHSLESLAATLGLPKRYLRDLADKGQIPVIEVNGRQRFIEDSVVEALRSLAAEHQRKRRTAVETEERL